mgnify:CR=1 FL=1
MSEISKLYENAGVDYEERYNNFINKFKLMIQYIYRDKKISKRKTIKKSA